jgi:hypothetical protein
MANLVKAAVGCARCRFHRGDPSLPVEVARVECRFPRSLLVLASLTGTRQRDVRLWCPGARRVLAQALQEHRAQRGALT